MRHREITSRLRGCFGLPYAMQDERLSSFEARGELLDHNLFKAKGQDKNAGKRFRERGIDSLSARLIL